MFGKGCIFNHQNMKFAGVDTEDTWACPYCHLVFERPNRKTRKLIEQEALKHGSIRKIRNKLTPRR